MIFSKYLGFLFLSLIMIFNYGCKGAGSGFSGFEDIASTAGNETVVLKPKIISYTPTTSPVVMLAQSEKTFAVTLSPGAGAVTYKYVLDGIEVQSNSSPIYSLSSTEVTAGTHSLEVTATNSKGSDSHTFTLTRNSAPTVSLFNQTGTTINCSGGTFTLNVFASDPESDALTFSYLLNGATNGTFLNGISGASTGSVVFTPNCSFSGSNNVTVRTTDSKGDYTDYTVSVLVTNPFAASINAFSPTTDPTVVLSTGSTNFSIVPGGNTPFQYGWVMTPGSSIASCTGLSTCPIVGTDFSPGRYTLTATLTDSLPSTATKSFTVVLNQKPQVTATPSNAATINMNCGNIKNFNLTINDANFGDASQTFSVTWRLNGSTNAALTSTTVTATSPMTSEALFAPNCSNSLLGAQSVSVVVSDGHESVTYIWPLNVNFFSETCNNLTSGQICTAVGRLGMSSNVNIATQLSRVNLNPWNIVKHSTNSYFISDRNRHGVWFYNGSGSTISVLGQSVTSNSIKFVVGQGAFGNNTNVSTSELFLYNPTGLAYSVSTGDLYIADISNSRIIKVDSAGNATTFAGGGASNVDGATRTAHKCNSPVDLDLDEAENKLFVTCSANTSNEVDGIVKYFMTNADTGYSLIKYSSVANTNGTNGLAGTARVRQAHGLSKHPTKKILFIGELSSGQVMAISYGSDTESFYSGAITLSANSSTILTFNAGVGNTFGSIYSDVNLRLRPYDLVPKMNGATLEGLFINNYNDTQIYLLNFSSANITYGGRLVEPGYIRNMIAGGGYSRGSTPSHGNTLMRNPWGMIMDGTDLVIADLNNGFVSKMSTASSDAPFNDIVGFELAGLYDGETNRNLNDRRLYRPSSLVYRSDDNSMYLADSTNYRVRKLNLLSGEFDTAMGSGAYGNANVNPSTTPFTAGSQNITALHLYNSNSMLLYTDFVGSDGGSRNCHVRNYNFSGTDQNFFGVTLENNKVRSVSGNYTLGCAAWSYGTHNGGTALNIALRAPFGVLTNVDDSELYISDRTSHCIFKVVGGVISEYIGTCNSAGNGGSNTVGRTHLLTNPGFIKRDRNSTNTSGENFFIVHRSRNTASEIKFVNKGATTVTINFVDVAPNEIKTVISSLNYVSGIATYGDQICYAQGPESLANTYAHNVECISRVTGLISKRIGRSSAQVVKAKTANYDEQEGIDASSATLSNPFDIEFDGDGNLWLTDTYAQSVKKVKKWF